MAKENAYQPLTPTFMVQLAAPHTWAASIFPVLLATCLAFVFNASMGKPTSVSSVLVLLAISVLLQSAVNTINDYFDYVKGTDTEENQLDPTDAVLVYNNVNPRHVLAYAIALIVVAFALGVYCIVIAGIAPLVIALIGVVVIFLYSGGKLPISYLPLGELASGFTMGGLITLASYQVLTGSLDFMVLVYSIPEILGIGLIMLTNNGCDIEKDTEANRKTLPVLLGHERTVKLYHGVVYAWVLSICIIVAVAFTPGAIVLPFMLLAAHAPGRMLLANPLTAQSRAGAFGQCSTLNILFGSFYSLCILASTVTLTF